MITKFLFVLNNLFPSSIRPMQKLWRHLEPQRWQCLRFQHCRPPRGWISPRPLVPPVLNTIVDSTEHFLDLDGSHDSSNCDSSASHKCRSCVSFVKTSGTFCRPCAGFFSVLLSFNKYFSDLVKKNWSTKQINNIDIDRKTHPAHQPVPPLRPQQLQTLGSGSTIENFAPGGNKYFHSL